MSLTRTPTLKTSRLLTRNCLSTSKPPDYNNSSAHSIFYVLIESVCGIFCFVPLRNSWKLLQSSTYGVKIGWRRDTWLAQCVRFLYQSIQVHFRTRRSPVETDSSLGKRKITEFGVGGKFWIVFKALWTSKGEKTVGEGVACDLDAYYRFVRGVAAIRHYFLVDNRWIGHCIHRWVGEYFALKSSTAHKWFKRWRWRY